MAPIRCTRLGLASLFTPPRRKTEVRTLILTDRPHPVSAHSLYLNWLHYIIWFRTCRSPQGSSKLRFVSPHDLGDHESSLHRRRGFSYAVITSTRRHCLLRLCLAGETSLEGPEELYVVAKGTRMHQKAV